VSTATDWPALPNSTAGLGVMEISSQSGRHIRHKLIRIPFG
jgi:hypothetical protein